MEDLFMFLLLFFAGIIAFLFVCWIIVATLLRIFAWVLAYWCVGFSLAAVAGLLAGFVIPFKVLSGHSRTMPQIATPDEVVAGHVITHAPRGFTKHFGWDRAWPVYNPYQARRDAAAVGSEVKLLVSGLWVSVSSWIRNPKAETSGSGVKKKRKVSASIIKSVPGLIWALIVPIPYLGFLVGAWASFLIWFLMMLCIGGLVYVAQQVWTLGYRWLDRGKILSAGASVVCPHCYEQNPRPSYRCPNAECTIVHHDVLPGPLGVIHRRCACGTSFPTTVTAASKVLVALCPSCGEELSEGSGSRRTIQLPAFGAVAAGKTRFFAAALTAAQTQLAATSGKLEPLTRSAEGTLKAAAQVISTGRQTQKTDRSLRPEGVPVKLTDHTGKVVELQLIDAAGESFTSLQATEELTYVNSARSMVFVLDPLAFPRVRQELEVLRGGGGVEVATGDQETAYASVVDRIRSEAVDLSKRHLAVVLTKTDVLQGLPSGRSLDPSASRGVRDWLLLLDQDGFVRRIESDFGDVRYFATDSLERLDLHDPRNPLHVVQWALQTQKVSITLVPESGPETVSDTQTTSAGGR